MMSFILVDLTVIPEAVKRVYLISRLGLQPRQDHERFLNKNNII